MSHKIPIFIRDFLQEMVALFAAGVVQFLVTETFIALCFLACQQLLRLLPFLITSRKFVYMKRGIARRSLTSHKVKSGSNGALTEIFTKAKPSWGFIFHS